MKGQGQSAKTIGNSAFTKIEKVNSDLLAITYGSFVVQLIKDKGNIEEVNCTLEEIGASIGSRIVDEFFAKSQIELCKNLNETAEAIAKIGFKMFLNIDANVTVDENKKEFNITFSDNPLSDFVELPDNYSSTIWYSNILCGIIRGGLKTLNTIVKCTFIKDMLKGDPINEIKVEIKEIIKDKYDDEEN